MLGVPYLKDKKIFRLDEDAKRFQVLLVALGGDHLIIDTILSSRANDSMIIVQKFELGGGRGIIVD